MVFHPPLGRAGGAVLGAEVAIVPGGIVQTISDIFEGSNLFAICRRSLLNAL